SPVLSLAWSPDGQWLATGTQEGMIHLTETSSGKEAGRFPTGSAVLCLSFGLASKTLALWQLTKNLSVWDLPSGKQAHSVTYPGNGALVEQVAISPDGETVLTVGGGWYAHWRFKPRLGGMGFVAQTESAAVALDGSIGGWARS